MEGSETRPATGRSKREQAWRKQESSEGKRGAGSSRRSRGEPSRVKGGPGMRLCVLISPLILAWALSA